MYGLLGSDNIWPRYNYLSEGGGGGGGGQNIEKIAFKVVQVKFSNAY